ncbi:hypothetical protein PISMIDRAFT_688319 [Pisolithus microcarpus 441]|uniref:Uncharacterized protein n=1 Tax=Pisolithus microcarpus 441 TaxID=765257 RepID=A0A0C9YUQ0_9AGAM|nr:hypothetical protein PISMIDRAFT_688319 [Pisolithus microcarpus 441]
MQTGHAIGSMRCALLDFAAIASCVVKSPRTVQVPSDVEPSSTRSELASTRNIIQ